MATAAEQEDEAVEEREPWNRYEVPMQHLPQHVVDTVIAEALAAPSSGAAARLGAPGPPPVRPTPAPTSTSQRRRYSVNNFAYGALYAQSLARSLLEGLDVGGDGALPGLRPSLAVRCEAEEGGAVPEGRAARQALHAHVAQMQRAPDAAAGVLVLGANVGSEAIVLHWALGGRARVVGVELLPHLVAVAREVQAEHLSPGVDDGGASAAPLEFRCGDALELDVAEAVPHGELALTLVYADDDSWDDALVNALYAKLARELPAGARTLLVSWHGASAATANATEWALLGGFPVDASWAHSCRPAVFVRELRRA